MVDPVSSSCSLLLQAAFRYGPRSTLSETPPIAVSQRPSPRQNASTQSLRTAALPENSRTTLALALLEDRAHDADFSARERRGKET